MWSVARYDTVSDSLILLLGSGARSENDLAAGPWVMEREVRMRVYRQLRTLYELVAEIRHTLVHVMHTVCILLLASS